MRFYTALAAQTDNAKRDGSHAKREGTHAKRDGSHAKNDVYLRQERHLLTPRATSTYAKSESSTYAKSDINSRQE